MSVLIFPDTDRKEAKQGISSASQAVLKIGRREQAKLQSGSSLFQLHRDIGSAVGLI